MSFELIIECIIFFWLGALTVLLLTINHCQRNQETLLYILRDEINNYKRKRGHIYSKTVDNDFECPKIPKNIVKKGDLEWQEKSDTKNTKDTPIKKY